MAARDIFQVRGNWDELDQTEARVSRAARAIVVRETQTLMVRGTRWLLHRSPEPFEITDLVARFRPAVEALGAVLAAAPASDGAGLDAEWFRREGVGEGLATRLAGLRRLIHDVALRHHRDLSVLRIGQKIPHPLLLALAYERTQVQIH